MYRSVSETASSASSRVLQSSFTIRPCSGQAWVVPAGHVCRLTTPQGPQVGDLNIWNANNPRERFWAARTRQIHASHVSVGDRLWSTLPYLRPLVTITGDSLGGGQLHEVLGPDGKRVQDAGDRFGTSQWGGRVHDLLGTRCDPYVNLLMGGESFDFHCHSNLTRAVVPFGLTELDVHDVLNVFQVTGLDEEGRYFMETSPAKAGEYFEFFAEVDVLCALSTCPGGMYVHSMNWNMLIVLQATCRTGAGRIRAEIWELLPVRLGLRCMVWRSRRFWRVGSSRNAPNTLGCMA